MHNEYAQENPRINRQDRRKVTFPGSVYPKEISQQYTPATQTEAVHCQGVLLGVFHPCRWPLKAPGSTLVGGVPNLSSARWCQYLHLAENLGKLSTMQETKNTMHKPVSCFKQFLYNRFIICRKAVRVWFFLIISNISCFKCSFC